MSKINDCGLDEGNEESSLEEDFEKTAKEINAQVKVAAEAVRKLNELRTKAGLPTLLDTQWLEDSVRWENRRLDKNEMLNEDELDEKVEDIRNKLQQINVNELESELNRAGWSTSSSYC